MHELHRPAIPGLADARDEIAPAEARRLHDRVHEKRRIQELDVDTLGIANREARFGIADGVAREVALMRGLALVGHLEVTHEAGQHRVPGAAGSLLHRKERDRGVVDAEQRIGDVDEARRRTELLGKLGLGALEPVHGLVNVSVDVDDAHAAVLR